MMNILRDDMCGFYVMSATFKVALGMDVSTFGQDIIFFILPTSPQFKRRYRKKWSRETKIIKTIVACLLEGIDGLLTYLIYAQNTPISLVHTATPVRDGTLNK